MSKGEFAQEVAATGPFATNGYVYARDARSRFAKVPDASDQRIRAWIEALSNRRSMGGGKFRQTVRQVGVIDDATAAAMKRIGLKSNGRILHVGSRDIEPAGQDLGALRQ